MLIKQVVLNRIAAGDITVAYRCWNRPTVKTGGSLKTSVGVLAIDAVDPIELADITDREARQAGFEDREEAMSNLCLERRGQLYRIRLRLAGPDPRVALRETSALSDEERAGLMAKLARLDSGPAGAWTERVLRAIEARPQTLAGELAEMLGFEKEWFKVHVRKLKNLGLTESLHPGYRLAPRGQALLKGMRRRK